MNHEGTRRGLSQRLGRYGSGVQVRICRELLVRIGELTRAEEASRSEIAAVIRPLAPGLLAVSGIGDLIAARLMVEIGGAERFRSEAALSRHAGCAPIEVSSGRVRRHRLSRLGNRKLNAALHRVVLTQAWVHPPARAYLAKKRAEGKSTRRRSAASNDISCAWSSERCVSLQWRGPLGRTTGSNPPRRRPRRSPRRQVAS